MSDEPIDLAPYLDEVARLLDKHGKRTEELRNYINSNRWLGDEFVGMALTLCMVKEGVLERMLADSGGGPEGMELTRLVEFRHLYGEVKSCFFGQDDQRSSPN